MKNKKNILFLVENGLSSKVIGKMTDNQVKVLVEKFKKENKEQTQVVTQVYDSSKPDQKAKLNQMLKDPTKLQGQNIEVKEDEMTEDATVDDLLNNNEFGSFYLIMCAQCTYKYIYSALS